MIVWSEVSVQGELENKADNCAVSHKHRTGGALVQIGIMVPVRSFHVRRYSHGGGMLGRLWFSCEVAQCGKTLIRIFPDLS